MRNKIIALVLTLISLFVFSGGHLFTSVFLMPSILWVFPLYGGFWLSAYYFTKAFDKQLKLMHKLTIILLNGVLLFSFLYGGFQIWKLNTGNILMADHNIFQINIKNIWFWVLYQTYLLLFFFSAFKLLITIDQK
ncbi:hypothetical protein [Wenyingzhuangia aestuarii]|uniref:hypothetical protein n=1 Tax=Wenyingzhuangia aestuarii TaxID=1647582 RepID=UPI00143CA757|nr:hypothetical protein [Wenyingzhuangia aestuarii]NJB81358.1 hypothetical protein [Wenyingzhuangia aestuarii]